MEALSFSFLPHTPGQYEMAYPDNRSRAVCVLVQRVCRRHHSGKLVSSPLRLSQLLALIAGGANSDELHPGFTPAALEELDRVINGE